MTEPTTTTETSHPTETTPSDARAADKAARVAAYEAKQEARRERLTERAAKARGEAAGALSTERRMSDAIPFGQPILVGHHSEKRHRRDIARMDALFRKHVELTEKAAHLERRAASIGTSGAISADHPAAIDLLRAKVEALTAKREIEKACNAALKKALKAREKERPIDRLMAPSVHLDLVAALDAPEWAKRELASRARAFPWLPQFDAGTQTEIRRCEARITDLEKRAAEGVRPDREGAGWRLVENGDDNRIEFHFDARQPDAVVATLKSWGFRWTPSKTAWTRQLTNAARHAAEMVIATVERVAKVEAARATLTPPAGEATPPTEGTAAAVIG